MIAVRCVELHTGNFSCMLIHCEIFPMLTLFRPLTPSWNFSSSGRTGCQPTTHASMVPCHNPAPSVRILVVGDADVGKSTFARFLCTPSSPSPCHPHAWPRAASTVGCQLSVRRVARFVSEDFYDIGGNVAYAAARRLFYRRLAPFDGILLVHNASDGGESRASIARTFVPEVMAALCDAKAIESGGRR